MSRGITAKPGQIKAQWGKIAHCRPDFCYAWGEGVSKRDARLVSYIFEDMEFDGMSFIEHLKDRGYDIETLRFSVAKKANVNPPDK